MKMITRKEWKKVKESFIMTENDLEFLDFIPLFGEKACGIAVIRLDRRFVLRFRIIPTETETFWVNMSAVKTGKYGERDRYDDVFEFDSSYEREKCHKFILKNVKIALTRQNAPSVHGQPINPLYNVQYGSNTLDQAFPIQQHGSIHD